MAEWITAVRELGLLALLVGMGIWLARWIPTWVDQFAAARERMILFQSEEREKDRISRHESQDAYMKANAELWKMFQDGLKEERMHDDSRNEKVLGAVTAMCRYENKPRAGQ